MREKTVRHVIDKYFGSKGIKLIPETGTGPDFHVERKTEKIEVKGSRCDFNRMLRQLMDYAFKYLDISLALPYDCFKTIKRAEQLSALGRLIEDARDIRLKVYVVVPDPEQKNLFYIRKFKTPSLISAFMGPLTSVGLGLKEEDPDSTKDEAVQNLIDYSPMEELKQRILNESFIQSSEVSKVQI